MPATTGPVEAVEQCQRPCRDDKNRQHAAEAPYAHAAGAHGGDFAVGGEAAQPDQNSYQHAHWDGVGERERYRVKENFGDAGQRSAGADDEFEDASQIAGEQHECEYAAPIRACELTSRSI